MATKLQAVIGLSEQLASGLTTHRGAWRRYLTTAARVYGGDVYYSSLSCSLFCSLSRPVAGIVKIRIILSVVSTRWTNQSILLFDMV